MKRLLSPFARVALLSFLALTSALAVHASDASPERREREDARMRPGTGVTPIAPARPDGVYDLHMLRISVSDGASMLAGISVQTSRGAADTDANGFAQLQIAGFGEVPVKLTDRNGVSIDGVVVVPDSHSEGLDTLVVVNPEQGTFESVTAGETGPERMDLSNAWRGLEASLLTHGIKLDPAPSTMFVDQELGRISAPGERRTSPRSRVTRSDNGTHLDDSDFEVEMGRLSRLPGQPVDGDGGGYAGAISLRGTGGALVDPTNEFEKAGYRLLLETGLANEDGLDSDAAARHADLLEAGTLGADDALALGAELLRQGAALDPAARMTIENGLASAGMTGQLRTMSVQGGQQLGAGLGQVDPMPENPGTIKVIDGFEPDNTSAQCGTIIPNGAPQDRGIDPAADIDFVCFFANCGDLITMESGPIVAGGTGDTHFEFFDPDGLMIGADDDGAATSLWSLLTIPADKTGIHVLRVRGFSATTIVANYRLWVTTVAGTCDPTLDDSEPNNTSATCSPKTPDGSYTSHWLRPVAEEDWYCFNVATCGTTITIDVNEPGDTDITARFRVITPSGAEILNSTATTATSVAGTEVGTYRVVVSGGSTVGTQPHDNSTDQNSGQYDLSILTTAPTLPCDTFEPDSTQSQCNSIPTNNTVVPGHSISPAIDEDWFCFDLACNDTVTIVVTPTPVGLSTSLRPLVALWGPTSTAAIQTTTGTVNGTAITLTRAANHAGTWYARVARASTAAGAQQTGTYNIQVLRTAGAADPLCDSDEPDSSANSCRPAVNTTGGLDSKALFPGRDEDFICIGSLICGDTVVVETFATPPANIVTNTTVDIYRLPDTTTVVATNTDKVAGDLFSRAVYQLTTTAQAGNYVARVRGSATTTTGPYDVAVTVSAGDCPDPDLFEPDNTVAQCNAFTANGVPVAGHNIFPVGDTDYYCTSLTCGQNLSITVTPTGGTLRPIVTLFDAFGVQVGTATSPANGSPITLNTTDNDGGVHSIRVTASTSTQGSYTISATTSTGTCLADPLEPDNSAAACRFVGPPITESRSINPQTDSDYYCVVLQCGEGVIVTVTPTSGTLTPIIRLDDASGTNLGTATASGPGAAVTLTDAVSAVGIYNIEVDASGTTKGLYDITISKFNAFNCVDAYEPDNTRDACRPIATDGSLQTHTILPHPDEDWVCFDVTDCGTRVSVGSQPTVPSYDDADTTIELYGPTNLLVASATTGGPASHALVTAVVNVPGTYKARIVPASTAATSTSGGQYDLHVSLTDVKLPLMVPPVVQTLLPAFTQLDAEALTPSSGYLMSTGTNPLIDISTTGMPLLADGLSAHTVPLGFTFNFYGANYTSVTEQDNGLISFSDPTWIAGIGNECIPNATTPNDYAGAFWEDLQQGVGAAEVYVQTIGTAPNRVFICQFDKNPIPGGTLVTLEILLYEGSNDVEYRYGTMTGPAADGNSATVGIEDPPGTGGIQYSCNTPLTFPGTSILFHPGNGLVDYPNAANCYAPYTATRDTSAFIDISATGTIVGPLTDESFTSVAMPIVFPYFGVNQTTANISSNGFLNFGTGATALTNQCPLPSTTTPNNVIAPFWDDLNPGAGGAVYQQLFGVPGSGTAFWVVQFNQVPFFNTAGSANTFEAILHEDGTFEFRYGAMTPSARGQGNSATIGAENGTGTSGTTVSCNVASINPGDRVSFAPAVQPPRFKWLDAATMTLLGTGPTYLHPIDGVCEILLQVEVRDTTSCCVLTHEQLVTLADRAAPTITTQPDLNAGCQFVWPPNHGYAEFTLAETGIQAFDACNAVTMRFTDLSASSQDEDVNGLGDGQSVDDIMISPDGQTVALRAERNGNCDQLDRSYNLVIEVSDAAGNVTYADPLGVCVYHDQGGNPPGPYRSALDTSSQSDSRPGWIEGQYGVGCGLGCDRGCDPTQR